ncbi:MAG: polysaccharide biosynthesis/export family protein [Deltaproteobacteria bacterium]|nr:polysaccharide biosynthesis/export family protein [Deltaproteobacteria bacterium]
MRLRYLFLAAFVMTPFVAVAQDVPSPASVAVVQDAYRVGPKDVLAISVYGEADLTGKQPVTEDGHVFVPLIGEVPVAGLTVQETARLLTERLADGYLVHPQVSVQVDEYKSQKVSVVGAVKRPGDYYLSGPTTLLDLIGRAGNIDTEKSAREVRVRRASGEIVVVGIDALLSTGQGDLPLRMGDVVTVPPGQFVYVAGEVDKPGAVVFWEGLTVTQALTKVGGPSETARLKGAYILRGGERIPVNLRRILEGREADIALEPGDQLFLKESPI